MSIRNRLALTIVIGAVLVTIIDLVSGGRFPFLPSPLTQNLEVTLASPTWSHLMGTDEYGRDILSRVLAGAKVSVEVTLIVVIVGATIGMIIGVVAGFLGGIVDEVLMRLTDMFLAFPALILAAAIAAAIGRNLQASVVALTVVEWPWYARLARAQVLSLREQEFVLASRTLGASTRRLMFRAILPNVAPTLIIQATLDVGYVMLSMAGLSFLGIGAQAPLPEWGSMILDALSYQPQAWWYALFPGLALTITAFGFNLLGDGLRDWLDPTLRGFRTDFAMGEE
ncbi:MAG TPA: ABC transporter permease [Acidimicrobiales bacterium]|nr:ABC transporter permease [Acidimicrobiales bacterium]